MCENKTNPYVVFRRFVSFDVTNSLSYIPIRLIIMYVVFLL